MPNRDFLMLAQSYDARKHNVTGWYASEKLDGLRCLWDGGVSRGLQKSEVPWANTDKDERYREVQYATGLWSRYGNVIQAPEWFLDQLPPFPLDGELFAGRGMWQTLSTIVKKIIPDEDAWVRVTYNVFDIPAYFTLFRSGTVNNPNYKKEFDQNDFMSFVRPRVLSGGGYGVKDFREITEELAKLDGGAVQPMGQWIIRTEDDIEDIMTKILHLGGEGIILRNPRSYWEPKRSHQMLKIKPEHDAEATVTGYTWGRETDKGSKLLGKMGNLVCIYQGIIFELSGFTDQERIMTPLESANPDEGLMFPGQRTTEQWINVSFPIGSRVTFKYRELSDTGVPKEGRYFRVFDSKGA